MHPLISHQLYDLMWQKIPEESDDSTEYGLTSLFLPDTLLVEDSIIKNWYFTSSEDGTILRKNKANITNKNILNAFASGVHPEAVCALVAYIDLSPSLDVHYTVRYLAPAQLEVLLLDLKNYYFTGIIQSLTRSWPFGRRHSRRQISSAVSCPSRESFKESQTSNLADKSQQRDCQNLPRPTSSLITKPNETEAQKRRGNRDYGTTEQSYSLIRVLWSPESSCVEARKSKANFDGYRYSPDVRCCTFFMSGAFQMVTVPVSLLYKINTVLTHLAIHISAQKQKKTVDRLVVYLHPFTSHRGTTELSLVLGEEIVIGGKNIDADLYLQWQQRVRREFRPPLILHYDLLKKVYIAITNPLIAQQTPAEYRDVYERVSNLGYEVQDGEARVNLQRTDAVRHILKCINKDIGTRMQSKAYKFISEVACSFAKTLEHAEEVSLHVPEIAINRPCVRCQAPRCAHRLPFKVLLSEPFAHISNKYQVFSALYSETSIANLYRLLHYILTNDKTVFKYRDALLITISTLLSKSSIEPASLPGSQTSMDLMANKDRLIDLFFSVHKTRDDVLLSFDKLQNFFVMTSITISSCVPVHLLRRCGIPEFDAQAFLKRLDEDYFIYKLYPVCQQCTDVLFGILKDLTC